MDITRERIERLMKRCQVGVGGRHALDDAHDILAECYGALGAMMIEIERLQSELAICRDAIEVCYDVVSDWKPDDDGDNAVRRTTMRRLNEAVCKATPRLLYERPEGQQLYGLHYREQRDEIQRLRLQVEHMRETASRSVSAALYEAHVAELKGALDLAEKRA
jgi:hypothetical protein